MNNLKVPFKYGYNYYGSNNQSTKKNTINFRSKDKNIFYQITIPNEVNKHIRNFKCARKLYQKLRDKGYKTKELYRKQYRSGNTCIYLQFYK
jgi:hypothetical protein